MSGTTIIVQICMSLHRGSYMSAHDLFNLLNKLGKSNKMRALLSILPLFHNKFNKYNNTGARINHMTFKLFCNHVLM